MSTIALSSPDTFPPTAMEQSSSQELLIELSTALAAGLWWAQVEVTYPISEEPDYGDSNKWPRWEIMEAGDLSWPSPIVFNHASEEAESQSSASSDAILMRIEEPRQIHESMNQEVQQHEPQVTDKQRSPMAVKPIEEGHTESSQGSAVSASLPVSSSQTEHVSFRMFTAKCALTTISLPMDKKFSDILMERRQKWKEELRRQKRQQRSPNSPQGTPVTDTADVDHSVPVKKIKTSHQQLSIDDLCRKFADLCL
ncbi:uncharacterized protein [Danio rerio]|uniref:Uncharacterized protein n=1 Tax=Danio rerio TaxID=7955 RepID=A0AB32TMB1_DANRE